MLTTENTGAVALESLRIQADIIALESMQPTQVFKALSNKLPGFVADVKTFVSNMLHAKDVAVLGMIDTREMEKMVPKATYVSLADVTVHVPPALKADWNIYLDALDASQGVVEKQMEETLMPTLRWISLLLTNPENLGSSRSRTGDVGIIYHDIENVKKRIAKCFSLNSADTSAKYGDVFKNNTSFLVAMKHLNDINERLASINKQEYVDTVNQITDALDRLLIRMKQDPETYRVSGVTMADISKMAFNLGHEIEFFAAHVYMVHSATQAMVDSEKKIKEILTR